MRKSVIVALFWWLLCLSGVAALLITGARTFAPHTPQLNWRVGNFDQPQAAQLNRANLEKQLNAIAVDHAGGRKASLKELAARIAELPYVKQAKVTQTTENIRLALVLYQPFALLNDKDYINLKGEIKRKQANSPYNPELALYLPRNQLQQFLPSILSLAATTADEGLTLQRIQITPSGIWTVTLTNGWVMLFGPEPVFPHLFDQLRLVLDAIYQRGVPQRFDFRYEASVAVTYQGNN